MSQTKSKTRLSFSHVMCTNLGVSDKDNDKIFFLSRCVPGRRCLEQKADDCFCSTTVSSVSPSQEDLVKVRQGGYFNISKKNIWDVNNLFVDLIQNWRCKGEPMTGAPPQERLSLKWSAHVSEVEVDKISFIFIF